MASVCGQNSFIIGFSGVTSGGKTSLCNKLMDTLSCNVTTINMDNYFWPEQSTNHILLPEFDGHANWEAKESVDFVNLHNDVIKWKEKADLEKSSSILLVDGIIIYNYKPLVPLFHKKYFFTLQKEQCWERRKLRHYIPPDPPGYYDAVTWPMYLKNKEELSYINDLIYIDGSKPQDETFNFVLKDIQKLLIADVQ